MDHRARRSNLLSNAIAPRLRTQQNSGIRHDRTNVFDLLRYEWSAGIRHSDQQSRTVGSGMLCREQPEDIRSRRIADVEAIDKVLAAIKEGMKRQIVQKVERHKYHRLAVFKKRLDRVNEHSIKLSKMILN